MGQKKYPPLTPSEVVAIVTALGFELKRTRGSHSHYGITRGNSPRPFLVTIDMAVREFGDKLIKSMISQSGVSREEFYGATPRTAKKI